MFLTLGAVLALAAPDFIATDLHSLKRLAAPQISPDGKWILDQKTLIETHLSQGVENFFGATAGSSRRRTPWSLATKFWGG